MDNPILNAPPLVREGVSTTGPERNWPLNTWWVAAHSSEVSEKPVLRWILELPLALYRRANGEPVALHNRCPHRWAPLSMGEVAGDNLICPYHGLQFSPAGQCVKVPTQSHTPPAIRVRSFPAVERYGFVWVWAGELDRADPALIPDDLAYLSDRSWHMVWGYKAVNANYMQLKENVLDLTHFAFLHKKSLGVTDWDRPPEVELSPTRVTYRQKFSRG
jgi:phenylpropionate dioxygenase-like ring-hydroxylating dioxygenase large terminal subunit